VNVLFQKDNSGYFAYCPDLKGCHSQGVTFEEAKENIREAIELYLETMSPEELTSFSTNREIISTVMEVNFA